MTDFFAHRSESLADPGVDSGPLELPEALQGALKDLSGALEGNRAPMSELLEKIWEVESLIVEEMTNRQMNQ